MKSTNIRAPRRMPVKRSSHGNVLFLGIFSLLLIIVLGLCIANYAMLNSVFENDSSTVEAATVAAASDVSRIIMNDPHYGFVSLSSSPAIGAATIAGDGMPTDVTGLNSIIAAARLEKLISQKVGSPELDALADREFLFQRDTVGQLNKFIQSALSNPSAQQRDAKGAEINPYRHAEKVLQTNLEQRLKSAGQTVEVKNLRLTLGWSTAQLSSNVPVPGQDREAEVSPDSIIGLYYRAFRSIPAGGKPYYFAALSPKVTLVESRTFQPADNQIPCSIVKLEVDIRIHNIGESQSLSDNIFSKGFVHHVCCACALGNQPNRPRGVLTVDFQGTPSGIISLLDFLKANPIGEESTNITTSNNGDVGADQNAKILPSALLVGGQHPTPAQIFADAIHSWIKDVGSWATLGSILNVMNEPFANSVAKDSPSSIFTFEVGPDGNAFISNRAHNPFRTTVRSENQTYGYCPFKSAGFGQTAVALVRNQCSNIGTLTGGKHAGQPTDSYATNWRELSYFSGSREQAGSLKLGELGTHTTVRGSEAYTTQLERIPGSVSPNSAEFFLPSGAKIKSQPRATFYCGGEISSISLEPSRYLHGARPHL